MKEPADTIAAAEDVSIPEQGRDLAHQLAWSLVYPSHSTKLFALIAFLK